MRTAWSAALGIAAALGGMAASGCEDVHGVDGCRGTPVPPANVYSVTGDDEVYLYWTPVQPDKVDEFVVYRASRDEGPYDEIGHTRSDWFVDRGARNGRTYFYAVTSVDRCGYESELSEETVFDTPRPEGFGARIHDADGGNWLRSGWDFSANQALPWDHARTDVYVIFTDGVPYLVAVDLETDVQDAGFVDFDVAGWAPDGGWSPTGTAEIIEGHVYYVWTRDNHFAKARVVDVRGDRVEFDWAYQTDPGNPELGPRPPRRTVPLGFQPGGGSMGLAPAVQVE